MSIKESATGVNSKTNVINRVENDCVECIISMCNQADPPTNNGTVSFFSIHSILNSISKSHIS